MAKTPKTHCKYGHELNKDNLIEAKQTYTKRSGEVVIISNRLCRKCGVKRFERIKQHLENTGNTEAYQESILDQDN